MEERNDVAQPAPAVDDEGRGAVYSIPAVEEPEKHVCPECGKEYRTAQALGSHRNKAHGVVGKQRAAAMKRRSGRRKRPPKQRAAAPGPGPESVLAVFQRLATAIESRAELDQEIVRGMGLIVKAVKSLRKVTIKTRKELLDLRREMSTSGFGGE